MKKIHCLNPIAKCGTELFPAGYEMTDKAADADAVLVRSASMHDMELPENLLAVGRAGAGVNNIPLDSCAQKGIVVFNTPGANANGVKELVIAGMLMASRDIVGGIEWCKANAEDDNITKDTEKSKKAFAGCEIKGKKLGVIGLGAIGVQVANIATKLGMTVFGYDPFLSVDGALSLSRLVHRAMDLETIYKNCDYITLHVPQTPETKGMFNEDAFHMMKGGVRILNLARGTLVNDDDMLAALDSGKVACYVTDFPNGKILRGKNVVAIPHLGASTPESEENCAVMAAQELKDYLENGNIQNSVNLPTLVQPWSGVSRLCIIHRNAPGAIASITGVLSKDGVNVANMTNKSKKDYAYTVVDVDSRIGESVADTIRALDVVLRVRLLNH